MVQGQEAEEISLAQGFRTLPVEDRAFRYIPIRAVFFQFVGQISAGDEHRPATQFFCCIPDALAEPVMDRRRHAGKANPHDPDLFQGPEFPVEIEGNQGTVVQVRIPFAFKSGRDAGFFCLIGNQGGQIPVVLDGNFYLGCAELGEIPLGFPAWGDVEVIQVHFRMGTGDDQGIRLEFRRLFHGGLIGGRSSGDLPLFPPADFREDDGGMGDSKRSKDCHRKHLSFLYFSTEKAAALRQPFQLLFLNNSNRWTGAPLFQLYPGHCSSTLALTASRSWKTSHLAAIWDWPVSRSR